MYVRQEFAETRTDVLHSLMRSFPLCTLVTHSDANGLDAQHVPIIVQEHPKPFGSLQGHIARANPLCQEIDGESEVLAIFHGPQAYISPSWYATKGMNGKVVPTWNYAVVHAYGSLRLIDDPQWLRTQIQAITAENERLSSTPWQVNDAPKDFIDKMMGAIIGVEITVTRLLGKWKVSQNQPIINQKSVVAGLQTQGRQEIATAMADLVAAHIKSEL